MPTSVGLPVRSVTNSASATITMLSPITLVRLREPQVAERRVPQDAQALPHRPNHYRTRRVRCSAAMTDLPIARNTALLSASLAANSGMLQLQAAVASLTLVQVLGIEGLLGLGPAIVLASGALAAPFAGPRDGPRRPRARAGRRLRGRRRRRGAGRDRLRRRGRPCSCCWDSCSWAWRAARRCSPAPPPATCIRPSTGPTASRSCCSAPSSERSSGRRCSARCSQGKELDGDALAPLWLAGSGFMVVALVLVLMVRPDPKRIAELLHTGDPPPERGCRSARSSRRPGRDPGAARGSGELRRDGRRDDAHRRGGGGPPAPRRAQRVPDHRRARDRHVRAGAGGGPADRPDRTTHRALGRPRRDGGCR